MLQWRPKWPIEFGPAQREIAGFFLIIVAAATILGLSSISSGAILDWWATLLSRLFGWWALPLAVVVAATGVWLLWSDLRQRVAISTTQVIGFELLVLVLLTASHAPLVLRMGADQAWLAADLGRGGGIVGCTFAVLLIEGLGAMAGALILVLVLLVVLYLMLNLSWEEVSSWGKYQARLAAAAYARWQTRQQGKPVAPEPEEIPWWEQEEEGTTPKKKRKKVKKPRAPKPRSIESGLPPLDILDPASPAAYGDTDVRRKTRIIEETLESFGVPAQVVEVNQGPTVTQFGLSPGYIERRASNGEVQQQRVRVARISSLANDLALALAASPIRIEAPVPGRSVVGLEVPNEQVSLVSLRGVMEAPDFARIDSPLAMALGEDVSGQAVAVDLGLMPHLLIAGATGSGKSVCINAIICCLLCNNAPEDLRMLMIDPKMVELVGYNDIPHLLTPVVVEIEQVVGALAWITRQMDERYQKFHSIGARNLEEYNKRMRRRKNGEQLPILVVFIDELADMMMVAPDEVERHICRVAQMGRATGIHLVIATQRPSVDVVTGLIKANFPARISFAVTSQIDSRVILDQGGAENLLGRGDMLFMSPQQAAPIRLQGCFVSDKEIERLTGFWRQDKGESDQTELFPPWANLTVDEDQDSMLDDAIELIKGRKRISTSFVQRQLGVGFPRAARLVDQLEEQGFVGPDEGGGRGRAVLEPGIDLDAIAERLPGEEPT
jgi:S-DNA-T family DNA segregation ATPase FtsK/SpoIIIE